MSENRTAGTSPAATTDDVPDEIVRSIRIDAQAQTVWGIVSEPGWFINDGEWTEHEITTEGDVSRVVDPVHGEFSIRTVELDPPRRAVFRWLGGQVGSVDEFPSNTIEFTVEPQGSGVVLTVRETGFAGLSSDAVVRRQRFEENSAGWATELDLARRRAEDQA
ncbi:SRPBCC domain-containing protein [Dietzia maris]|uniref:SRPBCC domain-containing protein n=1 Tax=Dietzia maris TaxID=37915 RepID=UPI00223B39A1|nr:SRPBCC domain-containing protein [Dietzia maris]MCT1432810.1 SRPBCC domain-containing protein [Dietzia maris]MCT1520325.1 SRPBCC domain-containing protein [Dietzia maris]